MKKNTMMRVASALLVAVLLTTCAISGTFAKYTTTESAADSARVAKWGVGITTTGTLFAEQYIDAPVAADDSALTVQVVNFADSTTDNVVAPGTKNETGITFKLEGKPEVDVKLDVVVAIKDIVLPANTTTGYVDCTVGNRDAENFKLDKDYNPVVFTLKNGAGNILAKGTLAQIKTYLEGLTRANIPANTQLETYFTGTGDYAATPTDGIYQLVWAWDIDQNSKADTYIGNVMAETVTDTNCKTDISFDITITAEQIN